jgi:hypothetical protein
MLKARAGDHIFFGLSARNLQLLREGRPIRVRLQELDPTTTAIVVIFYGETEEKMREDLIDMVGPDTVFKDELRKDS